MWTAIVIIIATGIIAILASRRQPTHYQHGPDIIDDDGKPWCCGDCRWQSTCPASHVEQCAYVAMCRIHDDPPEYSS